MKFVKKRNTVLKRPVVSLSNPPVVSKVEPEPSPFAGLIIKNSMSLILVLAIIISAGPAKVNADSSCELQSLSTEIGAPRNVKATTAISSKNVGVKITWDKPKKETASDWISYFQVQRYIDSNSGDERGPLRKVDKTFRELYMDKPIETMANFEFTDTIPLGQNTGYDICTWFNVTPTGGNNVCTVDKIVVNPDGSCGTKINNGIADPAQYYSGSTTSQIKFNGDNAPTVELQKDDSSAEPRPKIIFKLTKVILQGAPNNCNDYDTHWETIDNSIITKDQVYFYFTYLKSIMDDGTEKTEPVAKYGTIRIDTEGNSQLVTMGSGSVDDTIIKDVTININKDTIWTLYGYSFNKPVSGETTCGDVVKYPDSPGTNYNQDNTPLVKCLNVNGIKVYCANKKPIGWLAKWGVTGQASGIFDPSGGTDKSVSACGSAGVLDIGGAIKVGFCNLTVMFREWAMSILCFAQDKLVEVLGQESIDSAACDTSSTYKDDPVMNQLIKNK